MGNVTPPCISLKIGESTTLSVTVVGPVIWAVMLSTKQLKMAQVCSKSDTRSFTGSAATYPRHSRGKANVAVNMFVRLPSNMTFHRREPLSSLAKASDFRSGRLGVRALQPLLPLRP
jgi:hypothetical protein